MNRSFGTDQKRIGLDYPRRKDILALVAVIHRYVSNGLVAREYRVMETFDESQCT